MDLRPDGRASRPKRAPRLTGIEPFRRLWADHQVREKTYGVKPIRHPLVGELELGYETLALPGDPDQVLVAYTAEAGTASAQKLALLASWSADTTGSDISANS